MLTVTAIRNLKAKSYPYRVADVGHEEMDGVCVGLAVHVSAKGHKSFVLAKKVNGKRKFFKLGNTGDITLAQARIDGRELKSQLNRGEDPREPKAVPKPVGTVRDLFNGYVGYLELKGAKSIHKITTELEKDGIPAIADKPANEVTSEELADIIRVVVQRGAMTVANHVRGHLHAMFQWGLGADLDPTAPTNNSQFKLKFNPVSAIPKPRKGTVALDRFLSEDEVRLVWADLGNRSPVGGAALKFQLCTGQRVREVLSLKWDDIEEVNGEQVWFLKDTKNGKPHSVALNDTALSVLDEIRLHTSHCSVVFPARNSRMSPMNSNALSHITYKMCPRLGIERFSPRDLRRTFKTLAMKHGLSKQDLDLCQNHALGDVSDRHYIKYDYMAEKIATMKAWNEILSEILS